MGVERVLPQAERRRRNLGIAITIAGLAALGAFVRALVAAGGISTPTAIRARVIELGSGAAGDRG